jgi:hypothetical protein
MSPRSTKEFKERHKIKQVEVVTSDREDPIPIYFVSPLLSAFYLPMIKPLGHYPIHSLGGGHRPMARSENMAVFTGSTCHAVGHIVQIHPAEFFLLSTRPIVF